MKNRDEKAMFLLIKNCVSRFDGQPTQINTI